MLDTVAVDARLYARRMPVLMRVIARPDAHHCPPRCARLNARLRRVRCTS